MENSYLEEKRRVNSAVADALSQFLLASQGADTGSMTEDDKFKAAYALNLCTVSVSQIIDYNDVNFLEHEYEAILNNLNLEEMPKDEALLHILKQLLDVITYFRIQEGEKKLLEKEYQQKMKNAIWKAVPNIGLIVAGGNPVTMAVSLASQVGIGYMNYRKEKAKIGLEQERKEWELQRSAMEQFNGLRRELFDTAWRLAEKYKFPDEYRLTERQITQFNRILMDADDLRRYERLDYISDKFAAYPPFWYYLGNAANAVCQKPEIDPGICADYKQKAIDAFQKFRSITKQNLLREDQLKASCALELFDIWDDATKEDRVELLKEAQEASGNAFDVLQLCALSYMKINEYGQASKLLRMLVNEGYNTNMNAQLLSKIYVMNAIENCSPDSQSRKDYKLLQMRVGTGVLFPMPSPEATNYDSIGEIFMELQRQVLNKKYFNALSEFASLYSAKYDALCKRDGNISAEMIALLEGMCSAARRIAPDNSQFVEAIQHDVHRKRYDLKAILDCDGIGVGRPQTVKFKELTKTAFGKLAKTIQENIDACDSMLHVSDMETAVDQFCIENGLCVGSSGYGKTIDTPDNHSIALAIFGDKYQEMQDCQERIDESVRIISKLIKDTPIVRTGSTVKFYLKGTPEFDNYINDMRVSLNSNHIRNEIIVGTIQDKRPARKDLLICIDGIRLLNRDKYYGALSYLEAFQHYKNEEISFGSSKYRLDALDINALRMLTDSLAKMNGELEISDSDIASVINAISKEMQPSSLKCKEIASVSISSLSDDNIKSIIKETERKAAPHRRQIKIEGEVLTGTPTVGSYCKLFGQENVYKIIRIGRGGCMLTQSFVGHTTDFTLEKI